MLGNTCFFSDKQLADLKSELYTSRKNAYAAGSAKNLRIQWESFLLFCFHFQFCYLPADTETLCLYILKKVQVGKDQEKAQSEKDSHSKNRGGRSF